MAVLHNIYDKLKITKTFLTHRPGRKEKVYGKSPARPSNRLLFFFFLFRLFMCVITDSEAEVPVLQPGSLA